MKDLQGWIVAGLAFQQQAIVFEISKMIPHEEQYSLIGQIRRSSRSVCANIAEAEGKKPYPAHMQSKLSDADAENRETKVWVDIIEKCGYALEKDIAAVRNLNDQISRLLHFMINNPEKFSAKRQKP